MEGWVSFHRQIMNWEWYTDPNAFRLFFHLVLNANHQDGKWRGTEIKRGQLVTSSDKLAVQLGLSRQQVRTSLKKLESTNEITIKSTNKYTVVTVEKYSFYQDDTRKSTNKTTSKPTNNQPSNNHQITTNNNDNNDKNENKESIDRIWRAYPLKKGKAVAIKKIPKLLKEYSEEQLLQAITRYDNSVKEKKYLMHGSTFFNGGYMDYIEDNYQEEQKEEKVDWNEPRFY